jgi:hypothetical protein
MSERPLRLGDVVDDYCPKCRLLLNHDIASLYEGRIAKSTCRTCLNTHDFKEGKVPPKRSSKKKDDVKSLVGQVLAGMPATAAAPEMPVEAAPLPVVKKKRDLWAELERIKKR